MPRHMKAEELMATDLVTLTEDETLAHAKRCMERGRIRHLPVVRERKLVGLVTHRDILSASFSFLAEVDPKEQRRIFVSIPVKDIMHRDVASIGPEASVTEAAKILLKNKFGCLPVVDEKGELVGLLTEADFLHLTVRLLP